jgi:type 2 lantibiotic biosynthesis protein LanM
MNRSSFTSPTWYHALTLTERIAALTSSNSSSAPDDSKNEIGLRQLQRWRSQPQFASESTFDLRLAQDGVDQKRLLFILGESVEKLQQLSHEPTWLNWLAEAFSYPASAYASPPPGAEEISFLDLIQPLIDQACGQLFAGINELMDKWPALPFDPQSIENILLMNLLDPLLIRLGRTMVLELNVARLQGHLEGETAADRFENFIERIRQPDQAVAILSEYPVLARQLVICLNQWVDVSLEFLDRLCRDWLAIRKLFCQGKDPGLLAELTGGAGDTHRDGRSVMIAQFESGLQLVYKPKSLAIDDHFQELLSWLNSRGCQPPFRTLDMLDCGDYGWVEHVARQECQTLAEIQRFYHRLGAYLALLYTINASDFHLENLIACGEHPMLIDLETLFNPEYERFEGNNAVAAAEKNLLNSVLVVGMLPQRLWSQEAYTGIDISGFGGEAGQLSPDRIPQPAAPGTDKMRYIRQRLEMSGEANRPSYEGIEVSALDHIQHVISGFRSMYNLLLKNRAKLLADEGPLAKFDMDETRVLLRPTRTYDQLLFESFHPDVLRDAMQRDLLFDRLWMVVPQRSFMAGAITAEQNDLHQGDIPVFTTKPVSLTLWSASGDPIDGILRISGMAMARQRLKRLSDEHLRRQEWYIRCSLSTLSTFEYGTGSPTISTYQLLSPQGKFSHRQLLDGACKVAGELEATAVFGQDDITWIGLEHLGEGVWDLAPVGMDLYSGLPGIALFLSYAGILLQEETYTSLARRAVEGLLSHVEQFNSNLPGIGAFEGWGGTLYTLTHLAHQWNDEELLSQAEDLVEVIGGYIDVDENYGVMNGAAGAIATLLAFHRTTPSATVLKVAVACGDHLLKAAQTMETGLGWVVPRHGPRPLLGFSHGAAGIAWALLRLADASGCERFRNSAQQAIAYERSLFSTQAQNWPDLRQTAVEDEPERFLAAWCHGAAGIGLARLRILPFLNDAQVTSEIRTALQTTITHGFGQNHTLCHGDMGNLDLLLEAYQVMGNKNARKQLNHTGAAILDSIGRAGWQSGGPGAVDLPGLMIGIAGIGYQMLRLAEPQHVPSILLLDPPTS